MGISGIKFQYIPLPRNSRFVGRSDDLISIRTVLESRETLNSAPSVALFGLGGIGKTQLAVQYAYESMDKFDVILWITADTTGAIGESFQYFAQQMHLCETQEELQNVHAAIGKVVHWLNNASIPWLIVFDNAIDFESLRYEGSRMLLTYIGLNTTISAHKKQASDIVKVMGGLPLALAQIGGFISHSKLPLEDFLPLYEWNTVEIDAMDTVKDGYECTLATVWDASFKKLSEQSSALLQLLTFFDPDCIDEEIFTAPKFAPDLRAVWNCLGNTTKLSNAEQGLLQAALISKNVDSGILSVHRLVQTSAFRGLHSTLPAFYRQAAIALLMSSFPGTDCMDIGERLRSWKRSDDRLRHVQHIIKLTKQHAIKDSPDIAYGQLLLRCSWYLYSREFYACAREFVRLFIETLEDKTYLEYAMAMYLMGLINLSHCQPSEALQSFSEAYHIRKLHLGPEHLEVLFCMDCIAVAYTEMGNFKAAGAFLSKVIKTAGLKKNHDYILSDSRARLASLQLRMGKPHAAESSLVARFSMEKFVELVHLGTYKNLWTSDIVLLSRIQLAKGKVDDAGRLADVALEWRRNFYGNRLKTCDSLYDVACIAYQQGYRATAIEYLKELVGISESLQDEGEGYLARALYKLSILHAEVGDLSGSQECRERAVEIRGRLRPEENDAPFGEASFSKLTPWSFW
ncbi:P-loop containing nucleoside triphosphate hydrolase protein [Xylariomycetidae sp. FL2044]|nr:P-loop containing nucleoside triphosphate hydrolase protein [Xylariomycetidae sp. FL2044]